MGYRGDNERLSEVEQSVQQAVQAATEAAQRADQTAQDIAQSVQDVKTAAQAVQEASRGVGAETSAATVITETTPGLIGQAWASNNKRTYDAYQAEDLESLRLARRTAEELSAAHTDHVRNLQAEIVRMHTNAITHDNDLAKQHLAHRDIATDRTWNLDEVAEMATVVAAVLARMGVVAQEEA
jgi:hypothetical protein